MIYKSLAKFSGFIGILYRIYTKAYIQEMAQSFCMFKRFCGAAAAKEMLLDRCLPLQRTECLQSVQATGRVLSQGIVSLVSLPGFDRAAMDGFAVRSADTIGARPHAPVFLGNFRRMRTGRLVPGDYDAVVMLEDANLRGSILEITAQLHPYKNVSRIGEDIAKAKQSLQKGTPFAPRMWRCCLRWELTRCRFMKSPRLSSSPRG